MGLPPTIASATNRVGILAQSLWGTRAFDRRGVLEWRWVGATAPPAVVLIGNQDDRDVVDVDLVLLDQMQEKVERPLEVGQLHP